MAAGGDRREVRGDGGVREGLSFRFLRARGIVAVE